ncbi:MAG: endonuclease/exonuclease/phosphatase family protein [Vicinamibacterales bacterium]
MTRALVLALLLGLSGLQTPAPAVVWLPNPEVTDSVEQARWARAVGPPVLIQRAPTEPPDVESLAVITWNVHGTHGRLLDFIGQLKGGRLTGDPVEHFVLLVQEAVRIRHMPPPVFESGMKKAGRIGGTDPSLPDIVEAAEAFGLSLLYVPSMRNGEQREDRGNAILSTLPLDEVYAFELPFRKQRRVGIAATVTVRDAGIRRPLRVINVHFDTTEGRGRLYVLGNPRPAQARATIGYIDAMETPGAIAILGGDFNTFLPFEDAADHTRRDWSRNQGAEDTARTRGLVRLDYLFFRLDAELCGGTRRAPETFGSDHHPVIGRFRRPGGTECRPQ